MGDLSENSCAEYPSDKIPGVDVDSGEVTFPGVDQDFDTKPTGVELETGAYNEVYDAVPQKQGNEIDVYGLGQQDPTEAPILKLVMLVKLNSTTMTHKSMKALLTKRGGADSELAMDNETLHWHEVTVSRRNRC